MRRSNWENQAGQLSALICKGSTKEQTNYMLKRFDKCKKSPQMVLLFMWKSFLLPLILVAFIFSLLCILHVLDVSRRGAVIIWLLFLHVRALQLMYGIVFPFFSKAVSLSIKETSFQNFQEERFSFFFFFSVNRIFFFFHSRAAKTNITNKSLKIRKHTEGTITTTSAHCVTFWKQQHQDFSRADCQIGTCHCYTEKTSKYLRCQLK